MIVSKNNLLLICTLLCCFSYGEGWVQYFMRLVLLPSIAIYALHDTKMSIGRIHRKNLMVFIFIFLILSLSFWSSVNSTVGIKPLWKFIEYILLLIILYIIVAKNYDYDNSYSELIIKIFIVLNFVVSFSILLNLLNGNLYIFQLSGAFPIINANLVGTIFGIQATYYLVCKNLLKSITFFILTYLSGSLSAMLAIGFAMSVYVYFRINFFNLKSMHAVKLMFGILFSFFIIISSLQFIDNRYLEMSGRLHLAETVLATLHIGYESIFTGVGVGAIRIMAYEIFGRYVTLHNSYLELALSSGLIALTSLLIIIMIYFQRTISQKVDREKHTYLAMFSFLIIKSATTSNLIFISIESFFFVILLMRLHSKFLQGRYK